MEESGLKNGYHALAMKENIQEDRMGEIKFTFCEKNDLKSAEEVFKSDPSMTKQTFGAKKSTNLHYAASFNRSSVVEFLLNKGAPSVVSDINGNTPLHTASIRGSCQTVKLLLSKGSVKKANIDGDYPIHVAAAAGNLPVVKLLLEYMTGYYSELGCTQPPHSCPSDQKDTPLHAAAQFGQVDVMKHLLDLGAQVNARNTRGETPLHLAAGAKITPSSSNHVQILLDYKATIDYRTNIGEPASFYAVKTGTAESLSLLLKSGVPVRRVKTVNGTYIEETHSNQDSLLRIALNVGCERKCRMLIEKIMDARYKIKAALSINEICIGRRSCLLNSDVTDQDKALSEMTNEIISTPEDSESVLRAILDVNSLVAGKLLDSCVKMDQPSDGTRTMFTKVLFDLFLFEHKNSESTVLDLIIESGKLHLLQHPLIEVFIELKWYRTWKIFAVMMFFLILKIVCFAGFAILDFGAVYFETQKQVGSVFRWLSLVSSSLVILMVLLQWIYYIKGKFQNRKRGINYLCNSVELYSLATYGKNLLDPILVIIAVITMNKQLAGFALLFSTYNFLGDISRIPRMGSHVFMSGKVMRTILEFFVSYICVILGYTITFHITLHDQEGVEAFENIGDSLIKVMTMLLGEFDYTDTFRADWSTRVFFVLFLVTMSIVMMNLIVGLAIGDIKKMRKNANVYKQIGTLSGIKIVEEFLVFLKNIPCLAPWVKERREATHFKVLLDLQEGRYCNSQMLQITDTHTKRTWSYGCSKDTVKKVVDILMKNTNEGCLNEEPSKTVMIQPSFPMEALNKLVEKLEKKIDSLESKLEQHSTSL